MFYGCSSLVSAPELPAETLTEGCYSGMFSGCTSLVSAPELPAETLTDRCYTGMFYGCSSLVSAPELPAKTLTDRCYTGMFSGCTSLVSAPELSATTLADNCYNSMFYNCSKLKVAPALPATEMAESCYSSMFKLSGILKPVDISNVTSLAKNCFEQMYAECTKIGMSTTQQAGYTIEWTVPNISTAENWNANMFFKCGSANCCDTNNDGTAVAVNITYYVAKYYNITYDLNGGSGTTPTDNNVYRVGDNIDLNNGTGLSNGDSAFKGWNSSSSATNGYTALTIQTGNLPATGDTITFYAVWGNIEETYTYEGDEWDKNVGTAYNKGDKITIINDNENFYEISLKVNDKVVSSIGCYMLGEGTFTYTIENNGAYVKELTTNGDDTDYILIIDQYSLTYDLNGGSGTTPKHKSSCGALDVGKNITLASGSGLTKSGYTFAGWSTNKDATTGDTDTYTIKNGDIVDDNITLYAIWEEQQGGTTPSTGVYFNNTAVIISASVAIVAGVVALALVSRKKAS